MSDKPRPHYGDHQHGIYLDGLKGEVPELPLRAEDLEQRAADLLSPEAYWYVAGGAGDASMRANREAFDRYRLVPRMLTDVSERDLSVTVLGKRQPHPVLLAPVGVLGIIHDDAEVAVARAASALDVPMILSTVSSKPMEEVADSLGDTRRWFQLYWPGNAALTQSFVKRAEVAGFEAIVVTLDTKMMAWRERDLELAHLPFLKTHGLSNYFKDPAFRSLLEKPPEDDPASAVRKWTEIFSAPEKTWEDLAELRGMTDLPLVLKGVLHPDDAQRAVQAGVDGVIVSNHGGRQVDGAVAAIDALPRVADAVAGRIDVLFDSGIRHGSDALKALALGASAVLLGRPYVWGLACQGSQGVETVLRRMLADIDLNLAMSGHSRLDELNRDIFEHPPVGHRP